MLFYLVSGSDAIAIQAMNAMAANSEMIMRRLRIRCCLKYPYPSVFVWIIGSLFV